MEGVPATVPATDEDLEHDSLSFSLQCLMTLMSMLTGMRTTLLT
jgi:hypothetical protein